MFNEEDRQWLYDQFKSNGYDTGSYDEFVNSLNNDEDFKWWHEQAAGLGLEVGDINEFSSLFRNAPAAEAKPAKPTRAERENARKEENARLDKEIQGTVDQFGKIRAGQTPESSSIEDIPQKAAAYMESNPVEGKSPRDLAVEELAETRKANDEFVKEYDRRFAEYNNDLDNDLSGPDQDAKKRWLDENNAKYREAKEAASRLEGMLNLATKEEDIQRIEEKKRDVNANMDPAQTIALGYTPFGGSNAGKALKEEAAENADYEAARDIYNMAEQTINQGSKYDPGYEGNALEQVWTAATQFVEGGLNNIDKGSLTFGLSEGASLTRARKAGDKSNEIVDKTLKDMKVSDKQVDDLLKSVDEDAKKLNALSEELTTEAAELEVIGATIDDMKRSGASSADINEYIKKYNSKLKAYNAKVKDEYAPLKASYDKNAQQYETIMSAVDAALESGLTDGEKALLDALEEYTDAKIKRANDVSVASAAGAGAEQSAEFMLDFILTGGFEKVGTKAALKLTERRIMKKFGKEAAMQVAKPSLGAKVLTDMGVAAARTTAMFPRNLAAYGEQLTQMTGKDQFGRYNFDRSHLNAAFNTALTQYIEYWSEGFGEYFGAAEQAAFKRVARKAPHSMIGQTLGKYRGTIGSYLDQGKFNGMFNEMLEEVVGSTFNALAGWMSNDRVGDKEAMKDFFSGEQLATLALSFLPMSAMSAGTNIRAYNKMKERYDNSVTKLNPFIRSGAIEQKDLEALTTNIEGKTPEQITSEIATIADKAREKNGGRLPEDFTQNLLGYVEGAYSMSLNAEAWEGLEPVVSAYTEQYANPYAGNAYDLNQAEQRARAEAASEGWSDSDLDKDAEVLAKIANEVNDPALAQYAQVKAANKGLKDGYDNETAEINKERADAILKVCDNNGRIIKAALPDGQEVFITSKDATVKDGKLVVPTGADGLVTYVSPAGEVLQAKASTFTSATEQDTETYLLDSESVFADAREQAFQQAQNTISPTAKVAAVSELVGNTILIEDGNGNVSSVNIINFNPQTGKATIKDEKGNQREVFAEDLYDSAQKNPSGDIELDPNAKENEQALTPAQPADDLDNLIGTTVTIGLNGKPVSVEVGAVNDAEVEFYYKDANGNEKGGTMSREEFAQAMQSANAPVAETPAEPEAPVAEAPAEQPVTTLPLTKDGELDWDNMFNVPAEEFAKRIPELVDAMNELYPGKAMQYAINWYQEAKKKLDGIKEMSGNPKTDAENAKKRAAQKVLVDNYTALVTALRPAPAAKPATEQTQAAETNVPEAPVEENVPDVSNDTPAAARARGYIVENGNRIDRPAEDAVVAEGADTNIAFTKTQVVKGKYGLIEAGQVVPSHINDQENLLHFFARDWQPKDRRRTDSAVALQQMANNLRPEEITRGATAYGGAPVVNARGEVIQGNGRSEGLRRAYAQNTAEGYKTWLADHAEDFGLTREEVEAMDSPVLVRVLDVTDDEALALGQKTQSDLESGGNQRIDGNELAKKLGDRLGEATEILFGGELDDEATITDYVNKNGALLMKWLSDNGFINDTEVQNAYDDKGRFTESTSTAFRDMALFPLFQNTLPKVKEVGYDNLPNIAKLAIQKSIAKIVSVPELVADLQDALAYYSDFLSDEKFKGAKTVEDAWAAIVDFMKQLRIENGMSEGELHPSIVARRFAAIFKGTKSSKSLVDLFSAIVREMQGETNLFGTTEATDRIGAYERANVISAEEANILRNGEQGNNESGTELGPGTPGESGEQGRKGDTGSGSEVPAGERGGTQGTTGTARGGQRGGVRTGGTSTRETTPPSAPAVPSGKPTTLAEARAYFENLYGKGKRADNSVRVWELTHKKSTPQRDDSEVSQMALSFASESGLTEEEASELQRLGIQLAEDFITEDGFVKFPQFFKNLVETFGDGIRRVAKSIYMGAKANVPAEVRKQMDTEDTVYDFDDTIDINEINDEQESNADIQQGAGAVSSAVGDSTVEGPGAGNPVGADTGTPEVNSGEGGSEVGVLDGGNDTESDTGSGDEGANGTPTSGGRGGVRTNVGSGAITSPGQHREPGRGSNERGTGVGLHTNGSGAVGQNVDSEAEREAKAAAQEEAAYVAEKERIKDETDTKKLTALKEELKAKISDITDKFDEVKAKLNGQLRAVLERLRELFSHSANKTEQLSQEKVPYESVSDPEGTHSIGSVVPSGSADYMRDAIRRLEAEVGKPVAEYVCEELGYESQEEMFSSEEKIVGLSGEQVDAVGLAIHQMKTGRSLIVGDMTGVGKGRVGAALIRWGKKNGKKVIFFTEKPNLFSAMYSDIAEIGGMYSETGTETMPVPWIINNDAEANITDENGNVLVAHPSDNEADALYRSGSDKLPVAAGGRNRGNIKGLQYDFVMSTYSQIQAAESEEEGDSDKVKKKNARNTKGRQRFAWLKQYAKDAIVIMDESHTAAGEGSTRSENAKKIVDVAQGVTFMSATFAKSPQCMELYAIRSSMNDAMITRDQLIAAIDRYGIPMQEILASSLFKTGEMVRRERDFEGVKTNWLSPEQIYSKDEIETVRNLSDKTVSVINAIIDFQRRFVDPIINKLNEDEEKRNDALEASGASDIYTREYASTPYSGQVSNVIGMMLFALKSKKAAEIAIEQIKRGEKPVIAVDNTLGAYIDEIEGNIDSADFGAVLMKGLAFAMRYQLTTKHKKWNESKLKYEEVPNDRQVEKYDSIEPRFGENAVAAMNLLAKEITEYGKETLAMDLPLSPIDYIKKKIADAGYKCGEITKRSNALVQNEDGTWRKQPIKHEKTQIIVNKFNGGLAKKPLPSEETYDAIVMNRSGATGNSMHASSKYADQRPRKMIILQAAKDPNNEVQIRGRIDRTGQVVRGEYFYVISPIPAEKKVTMMLKQKLASLDANAVGSENVSSNRVDAEDMDNKYGDEVARDFLIDHEEIHLQMDPSKQMKKDRKSGEYKGRPGLLYNLLLSMQRMTCAEQELILTELEEAYKQKIEYLNQNGINDLATTTMNLEATTVDSAIMVKGKDNESLSEFAHDTTIERVEVNVLRKPMRSEEIHKKSKELGAYEEHREKDEDGDVIEYDYGAWIYHNAVAAVEEMKAEKRQKQQEAEDKLEADIREQTPRPEGLTDEQYDNLIERDPRLVNLRVRNENELNRYRAQLSEQLSNVMYATSYFEPGKPYFIPLNESSDAQNMYGRFVGFKVSKGSRPKTIEAVFATKDSRAQVSIPVVNLHTIIDRIRQNTGAHDVFGKTSYDYANAEEQMKFYDEWWDKMIPKNTSRGIRYMITGNILQAAGSLFAYRGTITTFTRKDAETGEITVDKGLLLAEDFDPENFMVRTAVTKDDVWNNAGEFRDELTNLSVYRNGDNLVIKLSRPRGSRASLANHPINDDEGFKQLIVDNRIESLKDELTAVATEGNAEAVLDYLYRNYGFTQGHLLVLPDSTEKPDRIVYSGRPYQEVINDYRRKYRCYDEDDAQEEIDKALKTYRMDITNEDIKTKIRELVQLRQAYYRSRYCRLDNADLAWSVISTQEDVNNYSRPVPGETAEEAIARKRRREQYLNLMEAYKEELESRGFKKGTLKHFKQGKTDLDTIEQTFNEFNSNPENERIAKKVFDILRKLNVNIFFNERISTDIGGETAGDKLSYNWRFMNEDWIPDQLKANTILHEMIHTATSYAIKAVNEGYEHLIPGLTDAAKQADSLFNAIWRNKEFSHQIGDNSWETYKDYGVKKNSREMMAETGANQSFRDDLAKVKVLIGNSFGNITFSDVTENPNVSGQVMSALDAAMDILGRLLDGFNPDGYRKYWSGTQYGEMSYRERDLLYREGGGRGDVRERIGILELRATEKVLDSMSEQLGIKINKVSRREMPVGHKTSKGYYNTKTGEMTICMDNVTDERDAIATVLHETVGHHGLRKLFGARFNEAMVNIYAALDGKGRAWVSHYMKRHNLTPGQANDIIVGVEEYLAHLAERIDQSPTVWQRIKDVFSRIIETLFGVKDFFLTDNELRYILRASYENLIHPDWSNTIQGRAMDTLFKRELGINETDPSKPTDPEANEAAILWRESLEGSAAGNYEERLKNPMNRVIMENQEGDLPVRLGYEEIQKETGKKDIKESEDYLTRHNLVSSRAESQAHEYEKFFFEPLLDKVRGLVNTIAGDAKGRAARDDAYHSVSQYIYSVSALERNRYKNDEIESQKQQALATVRAAAEQKMEGKYTFQQKLIKADLARREKEIEKEYEAKKRDWSGITAMYEEPDWREAEAKAEQYINEFKEKIGDDAALTDLWDAIRKCTDFSLEHAYKHGLLTREEYEKLHGTATQPRMWNYYVPLRGFKKGSAEEAYSYQNFSLPATDSVVTKKMKGRGSEADDPLAHIYNIALTEIVQGNENWAKQAIYRFVLDAGKNSLLSVREPWFVKEPDGTWHMAEPEENDSYYVFEEKMKKKQAEDGSAKQGRQNLHLDKIVANKSHKNEHLIKLKIGGMEKAIWVNGDPAIAQAVAGWQRENDWAWIRRASRALSNLFTTYSLDFTARNLIRDSIYSRMALAVKEDKAYQHQYKHNWWRNFGWGAFAYPMVKLMSEWESGKLQTKPDPTYREQMFMDFMRDGGQTGYTIIKDINSIKKDIERAMKSAKQGSKVVRIPVLGWLANSIRVLNEGFELLTRFTAYQTSREMGRSGQRSAYDAKEISVNFNRRGAQTGKGAIGGIALYFGATQYFYNAGVQGFQNFLHLFNVNPVKAGSRVAGFAAFGVLAPLLNSMIAGLVAGLGGDGGDDDWYWNLPEWVRRNNIVLGAEGGYLAIPLPVELRAFYGIGDIVASMMYHKAPTRSGFDITLDIANTAASILPLNPLEGYSPKQDKWDVIRTITPDALVFLVDWETNRDYTGRPLTKENPFGNRVPRCQSAYASTPKALVDACQWLYSKGGPDWSPGVIRDLLKNYGGGLYKLAEDAMKLTIADDERPRRWDDFPFVSGFTGRVDEDRSNSFAENAYYEYKALSDKVIRNLNGAAMTDSINDTMAYKTPEDMPAGARTQMILEGEDYLLGKMLYEGEVNAKKMKRRKRNTSKGLKGTWYESNEVERYGLKSLHKDWKDEYKIYKSMPHQTREERAARSKQWLKVSDKKAIYDDALANLIDQLMEEEYNHVQEKRKNGIPYEPKPSLSERAFEMVKDIFE